MHAAADDRVDALALSARGRQLLATGEGRRIRRAAGLSLAEVAEAVGITRQTLATWEDGTRSARDAAAVGRYARALGAVADAIGWGRSSESAAG